MVNELLQHPLSASFPAMPENELSALAADIGKHAQCEKGVVFEGMVLDGWHRYLACRRAGVPFKFTEFDGDDPVAFVLSKNLHRRHLNASQRAAAVVAARNWRPHGDQRSRSAPGADRTTAEMAREAEVSKRTIEQAKAARIAGLGEAVKEGRVSAKAAAQVAALPDRQRQRSIQAIREGRIPHRITKTIDPRDAENRKLREALAELEGRLSDAALDLEAVRMHLGNPQVRKLKAVLVELESVKHRRDDLLSENAQLRKQVSMLERKLQNSWAESPLV